MKELSIDQIIIGERYRKDYKDIEALAESIKEKGLIHPPVVDQNNTLIAGGRRLAAMQFLGWSMIPVTVRQIDTDQQLRELELEENLMRENLTWQEEVNLKNEILRLKQEIHGVKGLGRNQAGVSQADVARMLNDSPSNFSLDTSLADAMEVIPELANCKTKDEARKKFKQIQEKLVVEELMKRKTLKPETVSDKFRTADQSFIIGDALENLKKHPPYPYAFVNCDPPYGINLNAAKKGTENVKTVAQDYQEWDGDIYLQNCKTLAEELSRIVSHGFLTFWFGIQWYEPLRNILQDAGWRVDPVPGIWYATGSGQTNQPDLMLGKNYEAFFICYKGKPILNKRGRSNVFEFQKLAPEKKIHQTEKPVELMQEIIETFCPPHGEILSPFLGSGVDIMAAMLRNRTCRGFDLNNEIKKRFLLKVEETFK